MNRNGEQHSYAVYTRDPKRQEKSLVGEERRNFLFQCPHLLLINQILPSGDMARYCLSSFVEYWFLPNPTYSIDR